MADTYLETVKAKRAQAHLAKALQTPRQNVILAADSGLGKQVSDATDKVIAALKVLDTTAIQQKQLTVLTQLTTEITTLQTAIDRQTIQLMAQSKKSLPIPNQILPTAQPTDSLADYRAHDLDDANGGIQYIGFINPDGKWYIMENDSEHNTLRYYFGTGDYETAWSERHNFTYKRLSEIRRG